MGRTFTLKAPNQEQLIGTPGDDLVKGSSRRQTVVNGRRGVIRLLGGADTITGQRTIELFGTTSVGPGRDRIEAERQITLLAVDDWNGSLETGKGGDGVVVSRGELRIGEDSAVLTGPGKDTVEAEQLALIGGLLSTGAGKDAIRIGSAGVFTGIATIDLGDGNDRLSSQGTLRLGESALTTGKGDDAVDALAGGLDLWTYGRLSLGAGDDLLKGFATAPPESVDDDLIGMVRGGKGTDTLVLPPGRYTVQHRPPSPSGDVSDPAVLQITTAATFLLVSGMDALAGVEGGRERLQLGTFVVNEQGIGGFLG
jgi:hypothetical protein